MSSPSVSATPVLSPAPEEPTATRTLPLPSPNSNKSPIPHRGLANSSVNQRSLDGSLRKVSAVTTTALLPASNEHSLAAMPELTTPPTVDDGESAAAKTSLSPSSRATSVKENMTASTRAPPLLSPRSRTRTSTSPSARVPTPLAQRDTKAPAAAEPLDSPPTVPVTVTRRTRQDAPNTSETKPAETVEDVALDMKPRWTPRASPAATTTPLLSPRRRTGAPTAITKPAVLDAGTAVSEEKVASSSMPPPAASPLAHTKVSAVEKEERMVAAVASPGKAEKGEEVPAASVEDSPAAAAAAAGRSAASSASSEVAPLRSPRVASLLTPRQRNGTPSTKSKTTTAPLKEENGTTTTSTAAPPSPADAAAGARADVPSKEPSPAAVLATPRGASMASRVEELRARLAASRQQSAATSSLPGDTPRSSVGSVMPVTAVKEVHVSSTTKSNTNKSAIAKDVNGDAATAMKELQQALKEKEKEVAQLTRDHAKTAQQLEKAAAKAEDMQRKWEAEKAAHAADKKEATTQRLEAQKELRQAQATVRTAHAAQEKLQKEVERQREKASAAVAATAAAHPSSRATSTATTPMATPRGAPLPVSSAPAVDAADVLLLRGQLARVEKERIALQEALTEAQRQGAAAANTAKAEAAAQLQTAEEAAEKLREEVQRLADTLAERDEALSAAVEEEKAKQVQQSRADGMTSTEGLSALPLPAESSSLEPRERTPPLPQQSSPPRTPRQVVTFSLAAKEATEQLQEELTATQHQVSAYRRIQEHADRRIEQLETELTLMQQRAREAVEALQRRVQEDKQRRAATTYSDATALEATKKELAKVREECASLKQQLQEQGEEAVTVQSALEEAEDERDVYERQLRDLQQQRHGAGEMEKTAALAALKEQVETYKREVITTREAAQETQQKLEEAVADREALQRRCGELEQQVAQAAEAQTTAAATAKRSIEHYKKKSKTLAAKLAEAERELQVLGEDYTRVCGERDAAVVRYRTDEPKWRSLPLQTGVQQHQQQQREKVDAALLDLSVQSDGVPTDDVSRDLSDALLSANRAAAATAPLTKLLTSAPFSDALAQEQQARVQLEKEVAALQSKVSAMAHLASPIMHSLISDSVESLPSVEVEGEGVALLPQRTTAQRGVSNAPPRARSPQTTHALDLRFFDPTTAAEAVPSIAASSTTRATQQGNQYSHSTPQLFGSASRSVSKAAASVVSPRRSQAPASSLSPQRMLLLRGTANTPSTYVTEKEAALEAVYTEQPLPPVFCARSEAFTHTTPTTTTNARAAAAALRPFDLLFSSTAGRLLVSKRGRHLHRPRTAPRSLPLGSGNSEDGEDLCCCAALTSLSHTLYAARMAAEGLYHLKHTYRFTVRVLSDCDSVGDILVGFADRHVPLESYGAKRNAVHHSGCYYVSLQGGRLFAPSQGICGETYGGWAAAAEAVAARRWERRICEVQLPDGVRDADGDALLSKASSPCLPSSSSVRGGVPQPECIVRAGDEVACTLRLDDGSMRLEWNGVDCGVAFTGVCLATSLYPCVELNCDGGTVELL